MSLSIQNLALSISDQDGQSKTILNNLNLDFEQGSVSLLLGKNGSGKSTLSQVIMGNPSYPNPTGVIYYKNQDILKLSPDLRSHLGIFVSFQSPLEVVGVSLATYLKLITSQNRTSRNLPKLTTKEMLEKIKSAISVLKWDKSFLKRNLNEGMSGGERKKLEILQMLLLEPDLVILDEIDSGLDIEATDVIFGAIKDFIKNKTLIIISHNEQILRYFNPDKVIVLQKGEVLKTGNNQLAKQIFESGF